MTRRHVFGGALGAVVWALSTMGTTSVAQTTPAAASALKVGGDVRTPLSLAPGELKSMPRTRVDVKDEDGRVAHYEGVLVAELLKRAGAPLGSELRGNAMATYVV